MRIVPATAREAILDGTVNPESDDLVLILVDGSYTYSASHEFVDDLSGVIATSDPLASKTFGGGKLHADPVVLAGPTGGPARGYWIAHDTGTPSTSKLLAYTSEKADTTPINRTLTGADLTINFTADGIFSI